MKKILFLFPAALAAVVFLNISCTDDNINNIYLKLTEGHRADTTADALKQDTNIVMVQVLNVKNGKGIPSARVKITLPDGTYRQQNSDRSGYAQFRWNTIREGYYNISAAVRLKKVELVSERNIFIYKSSNPVIVIYIKEPAVIK
jgi:hypothetical protein